MVDNTTLLASVGLTQARVSYSLSAFVVSLINKLCQKMEVVKQYLKKSKIMLRDIAGI